MSEEHVLVKLQRENKVWTEKNFPGQTAGQMLLGIVEECGELAEAVEEQSIGLIKDALGDIFIYTASYCNHMGFSFAEVYERAKKNAKDVRSTLVCLGKIAHHHLKAEQKIRGDWAQHRANGEQWLVFLFANILHSNANNDLVGNAYKVWKDEVEPRDWSKKEFDGRWGQFKCHKVVTAGKIEKINDAMNGAAEIVLVGGCVDVVGNTWFDKHRPTVGGYLVIYDDGYKSYSPAAAFESGYTRTA